jgi:hypothetical protein
MPQDIDEFIELLQNHDWFWHYAVDPRALRKGAIKWKSILDMATGIDQEILNDIWEKFAPKGVKPPKGIDLSRFKDTYDGD